MNARNSLAMLSDSESELFITQSSFNGSTSIELSENNFESLFVGAGNEKKQLKFSVYAPRIFLHIQKNDSGRWMITTLTDQEIQTRNEARIPP